MGTKNNRPEVSDPKDLGVKIGSKEEAFWTQVKKETEIAIEKMKASLKFEEAVLEMVKKKIKEHKLK